MTQFLDAVKDQHDILHRVMPEYTGDCAALRSTAFEMFKIMEKMNCVGLAANQVGLNLRMFVMRDQRGYSFRDGFVCINPVILSASEIEVDADEGCASYPGLVCTVKRPVGVSVEYSNLRGARQQKFLMGPLARVFCHEYDHINGVVMWDKQVKPEVSDEDTLPHNKSHENVMSEK